MRAVPQPRSRAEDRLAVDGEPRPDVVQPLLHDHGDPAVGRGADVEQEIPASAHDVDQLVHQLL